MCIAIQARLLQLAPWSFPVEELLWLMSPSAQDAYTVCKSRHSAQHAHASVAYIHAVGCISPKQRHHPSPDVRAQR
jgi:hypothetical protein